MNVNQEEKWLQEAHVHITAMERGERLQAMPRREHTQVLGGRITYK